jgi:hypothetical protein
LLVGPSVTVQRLVPADQEEEAARDPFGCIKRDWIASAEVGVE